MSDTPGDAETGHGPRPRQAVTATRRARAVGGLGLVAIAGAAA